MLASPQRLTRLPTLLASCAFTTLTVEAQVTATGFAPTTYVPLEDDSASTVGLFQPQALHFSWLHPTEELVWHSNKIETGRSPAWHHIGIITFVGKDSTDKIDGAVILGLSLQRYVPEFQCLCLVMDTMSEAHKTQLTHAGWALVEIPDSDPGKLSEAHTELNLFRVQWQRLVYFSPHFLLRNGDLYGLLEKFWLPQGKLGMVRSCCSLGFEGGMMMLRPSLQSFQRMFGYLATNPSSTVHEAVSWEFSGRIVELHTRWNIHGRSSAFMCHQAVLAHFTGKEIPTRPDPDILMQIRWSMPLDDRSLNCTNLVEEYFVELDRSTAFLSPELRDALGKMSGPTRHLDNLFNDTVGSTPTPSVVFRHVVAPEASRSSARTDGPRGIGSLGRFFLVSGFVVVGSLVGAAAMHVRTKAMSDLSCSRRPSATRSEG